MPMYEFTCNDCGHEFEELVASASTYEVECPKCGSKNAEKKMSAFASGSTGAKSGASCAPSG